MRHDAEGFTPLLEAWRGRLAAHDGDRDAALVHLRAAAAPAANRWAYHGTGYTLHQSRRSCRTGNP